MAGAASGSTAETGPIRPRIIGVAFQKKIGVGLFGGEGLCFATLTGPGKVWLHSLPLSRLADRIHKAIPGVGKGGKEEGSVLGGIGLGGILGSD